MEEVQAAVDDGGSGTSKVKTAHKVGHGRNFNHEQKLMLLQSFKAAASQPQAQEFFDALAAKLTGLGGGRNVNGEESRRWFNKHARTSGQSTFGAGEGDAGKSTAEDIGSQAAASVRPLKQLKPPLPADEVASNADGVGKAVEKDISNRCRHKRVWKICHKSNRTFYNTAQREVMINSFNAALARPGGSEEHESFEELAAKVTGLDGGRAVTGEDARRWWNKHARANHITEALRIGYSRIDYNAAQKDMLAKAFQEATAQSQAQDQKYFEMLAIKLNGLEGGRSVTGGNVRRWYNKQARKLADGLIPGESESADGAAGLSGSGGGGKADSAEGEDIDQENGSRQKQPKTSTVDEGGKTRRCWKIGYNRKNTHNRQNYNSVQRRVLISAFDEAAFQPKSAEYFDELAARVHELEGGRPVNGDDARSWFNKYARKSGDTPIRWHKVVSGDTTEGADAAKKEQRTIVRKRKLPGSGVEEPSGGMGNSAYMAGPQAVGEHVYVKIPPDCKPGQTLHAVAPDGSPFGVIIPANAVPGTMILAILPKSSAPIIQATVPEHPADK